MRKIALIGLLLLLLLVGCEHNVNHGDYAELTFRFTTSSIASRGNVSDYPNDPSKWTQAERIVDGRYIYILSVYIIDKNKQIVATKENICVDAEATETIVTFDKSYNLKRGIYTVMAVANHVDYTIDGATYLSGLINTWQSTDYQSLMNNKIALNSEDNLSSKNIVQPLSMMKTIDLHAGNNMVEGELVRTFARMRIEVKNNSGTLPLNIKSLIFNDNFTQQQAYVFDDGSDRKYFGTKGAPVSTSTHALLPFANDSSSDAKIIEARTSAIVFDGYLLESRLNDGEFYKYTLDLGYESTITAYDFKPDWNNVINSVNSMNVGDESYFLLYNTYTKRFFSAGTDKVTVAELDKNSPTVATDHVWKLVPTGVENQYYILNIEKGLYMQNPNSSNVAISSTPVAFTFANKQSGNNAYITIAGTGNRPYYLYVNNLYNVLGYFSNSNSGAYFTLYKVNKNLTSVGGSAISYNTPIILKTIDPITQQSSPTIAIKRNDFINVLITVSYNAIAGKFEFFVEDWNQGGGSVEFD